MPLTSPTVSIFRNELKPPIPNPTAGAVTIPFSLRERTEVSLRVYDVLGRLVTSLCEGEREKGWYEIIWDAEVPQGIYFVILKTQDYVATERLIVVK